MELSQDLSGSLAQCNTARDGLKSAEYKLSNAVTEITNLKESGERKEQEIRALQKDLLEYKQQMKNSLEEELKRSRNLTTLGADYDSLKRKYQDALMALSQQQKELERSKQEVS